MHCMQCVGKFDGWLGYYLDSASCFHCILMEQGNLGHRAVLSIALALYVFMLLAAISGVCCRSDDHLRACHSIPAACCLSGQV